MSAIGDGTTDTPRRGFRAARLALAIVALAVAAMPARAVPPPRIDPPFEPAGYRAEDVAEIWSSRDDPDRRFESSPFEVPARLTLIVAGHPGRPGISLALEDPSTGRQLALTSPEAGNVWHPITFAIPASWVGREARVVASAEGSESWIGVTSPVTSGTPAIALLRIPAIVLLSLVLFLLPGLAVLMLAGGRVEPWARAGVAITASCAIGYVAFFLYFLMPALGVAASCAVLIASLLIVALRAKRPDEREILSARELRVQFALMLLYSIFVASLTFVRVPSWPEADEIPRHRFIRALPSDNALPQYLAENLWGGLDARELIPGWLSSDRPPLQSGLLLLQRPIAEVTGSPPSLFAQLAGMVFQSAWIAGVWALCVAARMRRVVMLLTLAAGGMSGFFLLNTAYVWPKMLAGALGLVSVAVLVAASRDGWTGARAALCATSACLAMLAHSGAIFALAPAALIFAFGARRPGLREVVFGCAICATLFVPWMLYQRFYAPPGNRLVMMHIAGEEEERGRSFREAIVDNYRKAGLETALRTRWANLRTILPIFREDELRDPELRRWSEGNRVFGVPVVLSLGWLLLVRRMAKRERAPDEIRRLWWVVISSLALCVAILFIPEIATAHVAAYTVVALLVILAARELGGLPPAALIAIVVAQTAIFVCDWVVLTPWRAPESALPAVSPLLAVAALVGAAGYLALCAREVRMGEDPYS